jgi:hypothetical protein
MVDRARFAETDSIDHQIGSVNRLKWQQRPGANFNDSRELWLGSIF